jgi:hypothetical protein
MLRKPNAAAVTLLLIFTSSLVGQQAPPPIRQLGSPVDIGARERNTPARPTPRWPDGRVNIGALPGQFGLWLPYSGILERLVNPDDIDAETEKRFPDRPRFRDVPFQPWARALYAYRTANQFEPHSRCKPSPGPRQFLTPYGVEFLDVPEMKRIFIIDLGGPHTYRTIYLDGRSHPRDFTPSYYGHSVGHWEGDTLVVDTRGFNEGFWFDRTGLPHTDQLHMIERFTRTDSKTMQYHVTIEDPGAYTRAWSSSFLMGWDGEQELFEYICQDNNLATDLLVGSQENVTRQREIVP